MQKHYLLSFLPLLILPLFFFTAPPKAEAVTIYWEQPGHVGFLASMGITDNDNIYSPGETISMYGDARWINLSAGPPGTFGVLLVANMQGGNPPAGPFLACPDAVAVLFPILGGQSTAIIDGGPPINGTAYGSGTLTAPTLPGTYEVRYHAYTGGFCSIGLLGSASEWIEVVAPAGPELGVSEDIDFGSVPVGTTAYDSFDVWDNNNTGNLGGSVSLSPAGRTLAAMEEGSPIARTANAAGSQDSGASPATSWASLLAAVSLLTALLILLRTTQRKLAKLIF